MTLVPPKILLYITRSAFFLLLFFATVSATWLCIETQRMTTYFQWARLWRHLCRLKARSSVPDCAGMRSRATLFSTMTSAENAYVREWCIWHHHKSMRCQNRAGSIFGWDQVNSLHKGSEWLLQNTKCEPHEKRLRNTHCVKFVAASLSRLACVCVCAWVRVCGMCKYCDYNDACYMLATVN